MTKNQKLPTTLVTPTTKDALHDRPISKDEIVCADIMTLSDWNVCETAALAIFELGVTRAAEHGLILVDTKYEFGRDCVTGEIRLIDEVHTPDSSRYWLSRTYHERVVEQGWEPDNIDKEFLRLWFVQQCKEEDLYNAAVTLPEAPRELVVELARRYIWLYELITGLEFDFVGDGGDRILEILQHEAVQAQGPRTTTTTHAE
jgi:phosphoribosylaminoimidazole-succinocarboxamide synthase